jgi:ribosomal protein L11 methyltransferase
LTIIRRARRLVHIAVFRFRFADAGAYVRSTDSGALNLRHRNVINVHARSIGDASGDAMPGAEQSWVARLEIATERARAAVDALGETLDPDAAAVSVFEIRPRSWQIAIHFSARIGEAAVRSAVASCLGTAAADALVLEAVTVRDWIAESLAGLTPVCAGRFIVHSARDRARLPACGIPIEIEAALAFGTGHHGTTRGCLLSLDRWLKRSRRQVRVLDVGTGTGVLAIAAVKVLRRPVLASDVDPVAVRIARANAQANGAGPLLRVIHAAGVGTRNITGGRSYDLVFANILLAPLKRMAAPLARLVTPGGMLVLSGLLAPQANAALAGYRQQNLRLAHRADLEGWTTLCLVRPEKCRRRTVRPRRRSTINGSVISARTAARRHPSSRRDIQPL